MKIHKAFLAGLALVAAAVASSAAFGAGDGWRARGGLRAIGLKAYWSVLREDQKDEAKEILADFLAATAADRSFATARLLDFRADVLALLGPEQIREAGRLRRAVAGLPRERRIELLDRLLDRTDRSGLADRVERLAGASPEQRVTLGFEILDLLLGAVLEELRPRLSLTAEQQASLRDLYGRLEEEIRPASVRIAAAKAEATRKALSLLDAGQRARLEQIRETVTAKVLGFLAG